MLVKLKLCFLMGRFPASSEEAVFPDEWARVGEVRETFVCPRASSERERPLGLIFLGKTPPFAKTGVENQLGNLMEMPFLLTLPSLFCMTHHFSYF